MYVLYIYIYIYIYISIHIGIYITGIYIYMYTCNTIKILTKKVLNTINKQYSNYVTYGREIKLSFQVLRVSCKYSFTFFILRNSKSYDNNLSLKTNVYILHESLSTWNLMIWTVLDNFSKDFKINNTKKNVIKRNSNFFFLLILILLILTTF